MSSTTSSANESNLNFSSGPKGAVFPWPRQSMPSKRKPGGSSIKSKTFCDSAQPQFHWTTGEGRYGSQMELCPDDIEI